MPSKKKVEEINKKQGGMWFEYKGRKFFVKSPFAISLLEYLSHRMIKKKIYAK